MNSFLILSLLVLINLTVGFVLSIFLSKKIIKYFRYFGFFSFLILGVFVYFLVKQWLGYCPGNWDILCNFISFISGSTVGGSILLITIGTYLPSLNKNL